MHPLKKIIEQNRKGTHIGVCSVCSSNSFVIESAMEEAKIKNSVLLIEATANQVNQFGGYTGMKPDDFRAFINELAKKTNYPADKIILGGDHLGPLTWQNENEKEAMEKAKELIREFVKAGFSKIHIDTSMKLADDAEGKLSSEIIARRGAILCKIAEDTVNEFKLERPCYVIGSEVPIPGGTQSHEELSVTTEEDFVETVDIFKKTFEEYGLNEAWKNVIAFVVQPGVEFGSDSVHDYKPSEAERLVEAIKKYDGIAFEGHSTDYQSINSLKSLVDDHVVILKVGPALTFALREGFTALEIIEKELINDSSKLSHFAETLEDVMLKNPDNWIKHYKYDEKGNKIAREYSYSDRCRYYLGTDDVSKAIDTLISNLRKVSIPMPLVSQYLPSVYWRVRSGEIENDPYELAKANVKVVLDMYYSSVA